MNTADKKVDQNLVNTIYKYILKLNHCDADLLKAKFSLSQAQIEKVFAALVLEGKLTRCYPKVQYRVTDFRLGASKIVFTDRYLSTFQKGTTSGALLAFTIYQLKQHSALGFSEIAGLYDMQISQTIHLYKRADQLIKVAEMIDKSNISTITGQENDDNYR